jgi:O-antigen/teichoic acid export membrane protein
VPENKSSYKQIIKATSLFGGVQVFSIIISIIRSKAIAFFIGPIGIGIIGLLNSSLGLIGEFTKLGLDTAAVKDIAFAANSNTKERVPIVVSSLRKLVWLTGFLGVLVTLMLSPLLSKFAFGNYDYTLAFIWISISLLFKQLSNGQIAVLQGLRKLNFLAKANLFGNFIGLIITLPLYFFFRIDAIVPSIIIISLVSLFFSWWFSKKVQLDKVNISIKEALIEGKEMIKLGFMLSLRGLITLASVYALQIFISHFGGIDQVGFYTAGFVILDSYVGLIFNAMRTDYFPRLSAIISDESMIRNTVKHQALIAILIVTPIIILFLTAAPLIVQVLYSNQFLIIVGMVSWGVLATLFKSVSWSMGYVILAKGDSKIFIITALIFNALFFAIGVFGYYYYGLLGLGIGLLIYYIIHFLCVKLITFKMYNLYFDREFYNIFFTSIIFCTIAFLGSFLENHVLKFSIMIVMAVISVIFTIRQLDKRIDIIEILKKIKNKIKK